jgi:energy-converting hydrogenase B subunit D
VTILICAVLVLVAASGTVVVTTRDPKAQAVTLSVYGLVLALLFFVLQAPDVALSQIAVGSALVPLMVLLAVRTVGRERKAK